MQFIDFLRTIIYNLSYILSRDDYSDNQLLPQPTAPETDISFDPRQWGTSSLKDEEPHINFVYVGGGYTQHCKIGAKVTWRNVIV